MNINHWKKVVSRQRQELENYRGILSQKDKQMDALEGNKELLEHTIQSQKKEIEELENLVGELRTEINWMQQLGIQKKPIKNNLSVVRLTPIQDKKTGELD